MGHSICSCFLIHTHLGHGLTTKKACPDGSLGSGAKQDTACRKAGHRSQESRQGWARGTPSVCLVLVKEKFAPRAPSLALPLGHRPKGRTPLWLLALPDQCVYSDHDPLVGHEVGLLGHSEHGRKPE